MTHASTFSGIGAPEIWKPVIGHEGRYEVSNHGNVRSLDYAIMQKNPHNGKMQQVVYKGRAIIPTEINSGYLSVCLRKDNVRKRFLIHRLVAMAFVPNENSFRYVNHKDEDKHNNCAENLEWCSQLYNCNYGKHNEKLSIAHTNNVFLSFKVLQMDKQGNIVKEYPSANEASRQTGISLTGIVRCCNCKKYYHSAGGYKWRYKNDNR